MPRFENDDVPIEEKQRNANPLWSTLGWGFLLLMVYLLSSGPALYRRGMFLPQSFYKFYSPVLQLYEHTLLKKPIGMYWHLWNPDLYDANGNYIFHIVPD